MIGPRTGHQLTLVRVVGPPRQDPEAPDSFKRSLVAVQRCDNDEMLDMQAGQLGRPFRDLRSEFASRLGAARWAGYRFAALLALKNSGIPIAVVAEKEGRAYRPPTLFDAGQVDGRGLVCANSWPGWLRRHLPKHMLPEHHDAWRRSLRWSSPEIRPADVVAALRQLHTNIDHPSSWPLVELYSYLSTVAFRRDGPNQLHVRFPRPGEVDLAGLDIHMLAAAKVAKCSPGQQSLTCETLRGFRAGAKARFTATDLTWSTLHVCNGEETVIRERARLAERSAWLRSSALLTPS